MPAVRRLPARRALLIALDWSTRVARAPRGRRLGRRLDELRSFAEEQDRKVDLAGNLRPSVLRRHKRKSVGW
jgi:hypothetical protein